MAYRLLDVLCRLANGSSIDVNIGSISQSEGRSQSHPCRRLRLRATAAQRLTRRAAVVKSFTGADTKPIGVFP